MLPQIIARRTWHGTTWAGPVHSVPPTTRTEFVVHYNGATGPRSDRGPALGRELDDEHAARGWAGIGYNFAVGLDGVVLEGRGWDLVGAHCPGHNRTGIGVYVAVGGAIQPTPQALRAVRALYDEACRRAGRPLRKTWHGANYATDCPGPKLIAWVTAGMPDPLPAPTPKDPAMAPQPPFTAADLAPVWKVGWGGESAEDRLAAAAAGTAVQPSLEEILTRLDRIGSEQARQGAVVDRLAAASPATAGPATAAGQH